MKDLNPSIFKVALIAHLPIEAQAAMHMLDVRHEGSFPLTPNDGYVFRAGEMCGHNIVIVQLPPESGTAAAAAAAALASQLKQFFPHLWFALLVGVAAGLPSARRDIRLGDVLVAAPDGETPALVACDLGSEAADGPRLHDAGHGLAPPESPVCGAIRSIADERPDEALRLLRAHYERVKDRVHRTGTFCRPGAGTGTQGGVVMMPPRKEGDGTCVWYGPIGSGEKLARNRPVRDELRDRHGLIGLEMGPAGTMNRVAAGVIRGVCDYADENENKQWQPYAAAMAVAYAKAVLDRIMPQKSVGVAAVKEGGGAGKMVQRTPVDNRGETDGSKGRDSSESSDDGENAKSGDRRDRFTVYNKHNKGVAAGLISGGKFSFTIS